MAHGAHRADMFQWRRFTKTDGTSSNRKVHLSDTDINSWMKRVEVASEYALSEVFSVKKAQTGKPSRAVALQSIEQLQDHDDACTEAQAILSDWMNQKMRQELEMDEEHEDVTGPSLQPPDYKNFDDMYSKLAEEDDTVEVHHFLQDLMDTDVMDLQADGPRKEGGDPSVTMELRHRLVKERRTRRDAERERQRGVEEAQRKAREEVQRAKREEQRRRKQEACRQEELLQQEVVRLRKLMEEKRSVEQLARKMERERSGRKKAAQNSGPMKPDSVTHRGLGHTHQEVEAKLPMVTLQCLQRHFSAWYSVVLEKRVCLGKAAALCDWKKQLRAWRAWRALVWARRQEREAERTGQELRLDNKRHQLAEQGDRRRLLRRCLNDWRVWCLVEKERKELLDQQEDTRRKMAALIDAAASGKLPVREPANAMPTARTESTSQSVNRTQVMQVPAQRTTSAQSPPTRADSKPTPPTQAWQVTRRHAAVSPPDVHETRRPDCAGGRFEHRHAAQQRTISKQRHLLKEQQELILQLQEQQNLTRLRLEAERVEAGLTSGALIKRPVSRGDLEGGDSETRSNEASGEGGTDRPASKEPVNHRAHPAVRAMEERARRREERRREVLEMKRKKEEEKLAQMKAEEEERRRQEEEEKRAEAERRKEERRRKKEKELEKQRRTEREQTLLKSALEHHDRSLLHHRGMKPWKRLVQNSHANAQKAVRHHDHVLQRRCLTLWARASEWAAAERRARAEQFYDRVLLQRTLHGWQEFKHLWSHLEEQAQRLYAARAQRKVFAALLDHVTVERLVSRDKERLAAEHSARRGVRRCFGAWRRLPEAQREEREREVRREELRRKVAEILPDFRASPLDCMGSPTMTV